VIGSFDPFNEIGNFTNPNLRNLVLIATNSSGTYARSFELSIFPSLENFEYRMSSSSSQMYMSRSEDLKINLCGLDKLKTFRYHTNIRKVSAFDDNNKLQFYISTANYNNINWILPNSTWINWNLDNCN